MFSIEIMIFIYTFEFIFFSYLIGKSGNVLASNPDISITDPLIALKILRNFGHMIKNLSVDFSLFNAKICTKIENCSARYCFGALSLIYGIRKSLQGFENVIHYENVEYLTLKTFNMTRFTFSFENLRHLTIGGGIKLNDAFCEFIGNIEHLQTLKISSWSSYYTTTNSFRKMLELQNIQSNIVEMQFRFDEKMSRDDIVRFLKQSRKLRKLSFYYVEKSFVPENVVSTVPDVFISTVPVTVMQSISSNLDVGWKIDFIEPFMDPFHFTSPDCKCYVFERIIDE